MMDVMATSPPQIYTHLTVKVVTDPQLHDSICSISNSCLCSLQRDTHSWCPVLIYKPHLVACTISFHNRGLIAFICPGVNFFSSFLFLMLNVLSFSFMFTFVTVDFHPLHACLCCINENWANLPVSVHPHILALCNRVLLQLYLL